MNSEVTHSKKAFVLGAGITGLVLAWKLAKNGGEVIIIESSSSPGGLAKTIEWDGFRFDNGAHNFFTYDSEVLTFYQELLGDMFRQKARNFKLYIFNKLLKFPFLGTEIITSLGSIKMINISISFLSARLKAFFVGELETPHLDEWIISRYGKALYRIYFRDYLFRVQKCDPHLLSSTIGMKKIPKMSVRKTLGEIFRKLFLSSPVSKNTSKSYYCKHGYGEMPMYFYRELIKMPNVTYRSEESVQNLTINEEKITSLKTDKHLYNTENADIISTIPLECLCKFTNPEFEHLTALSQKLQYVGMRFFHVKINKPSVTGCWFVNFNDKRMPFYRVGEYVFDEFDMLPEGYSSLTFEIPVNEGDEYFKMPDSELMPLLIERFNIVFSLSIDDVVGYKSVFSKHANPRLTLDYQDILKEIFNFILSIQNLYSLGRQGLFTYANLDHCTRMAFDFSKHYLEGSPKEGNKSLLNKYFHSGF